jgi:hypothetical protein
MYNTEHQPMTLAFTAHDLGLHIHAPHFITRSVTFERLKEEMGRFSEILMTVFCSFICSNE